MYLGGRPTFHTDEQRLRSDYLAESLVMQLLVRAGSAVVWWRRGPGGNVVICVPFRDEILFVLTLVGRLLSVLHGIRSYRLGSQGISLREDVFGLFLGDANARLG